MATEPYKPVPKVEPTAQPPFDYFHLDVTPGMFGAHIAKGLEQFGAETSRAADIWGEVQTDYQLNNAMKETDDALEEYRRLRGADALNAEQHYRERMDQIRDKYSAGLSGTQLNRFDNAYRTYQYRYVNGQIATHSITQGYDFAKETNMSSTQQAMSHAAQNYNNPEQVEAARQDARAAAVKQLQLDGAAGDPAAVKEALRRADTATYKSAAEAMYVHDPIAAAKYVEDHKQELGQAYAPLADQFRERAARIGDEQKADVIRKIYQQSDPTVREGLARANREVIGDDAYRAITGEPAPAGTPATNVIPFKPPEPASVTKPAEPTPPPARLPGETPQEWLKRNQNQNFTSTSRRSELEATPTQQQVAMNYTPAQAGMAKAINANTDKNLNLDSVPGNILERARDVALFRGPGGLQQFMADQGYPKAGAWCGEFAAAVVKSTGGKPPANPEVASNWRTWGLPVSAPVVGGIAVRRGPPTGSTGSHITFVSSVNPQNGTFVGIGGNQGAGHAERTFRTDDYVFRTTTMPEQQAAE